MKFRIARLWSPKPPRHAYPTGTGRKRATVAPAVREQRPKSVPAAPADAPKPAPLTDYTVPPINLPTGSDGSTVLIPGMRTVTLPADTPAVARSMAETVMLPAAAAAVPPSVWYGAGTGHDVDWPDVPADAPPQVAKKVSDSGEQALSALESHLASTLGNSALRFRTGVDGIWFNTGESLLAFWRAHPTGVEAVKAAQDAEDKAAAHDAAMADFHRRSELMLGGSVPKRTNVVGCDTSIFATVYAAEFAGTHAVRNGAAL